MRKSYLGTSKKGAAEMQRTCARCGSVTDGSSRFCTNCGAPQESAPAYRQSWEAPPAQNQGQIPSWAQAQGGAYQQYQQYQQPTGMNNQNAGGSLGFGGPADAQANQLLKIAGIVILSGLLLFLICVALAIVIPIPGIRTFFLIIALLLILIPWIIYKRIRRMIRRTVGRVRWFM